MKKSSSLANGNFCEHLSLHTGRCSSSHGECDSEVIQCLMDKQMWPPSSPGISTRDFAVWSIYENDLSTRCYPNLDSLKAAFQSAWTKFDEEVVQRSCASVKARIRLMIKA